MNTQLEGRKILLTRAMQDAAPWVQELRARGAEPIEFPCLETQLIEEASEELAKALTDSDWVAFFSQHSVEALATLCPLPWKKVPRFACVGAATATRCEQLLGAVDFVPTVGTGAGMARELESELTEGSVICLPTARAGRRDFEERFNAERLRRVAVYETTIDSERATPPAHDAIFFASPSAVEGFAVRAGAPASGTLLVAIGETTAAALEAKAWTPIAVAQRHDLDGLIDAALAHWRLSKALPSQP